MFTATVNGALSRLGLNPRGTAPFPKSTAPMLMHKASRLVSLPDWTYEPKWDGFRVIATVGDGSVRLLSRNGHSFTRLFGPVSDALHGFPYRSCWTARSWPSPIRASRTSKRSSSGSGRETESCQVMSAI